MDIRAYIESGVIEDYCLGILDAAAMQGVAQNAALYAEVQDEIDACQTALKKFAADFGHGPKQQAKQNLLNIIDSLSAEETLTAGNLPLINKYSDAAAWLHFVKPLLPATLQKPFMLRGLTNKNGVEQFVFWTKDGMPDETHQDEQETILLLQGKCRCHIGGEVVELAAGDFLSIPMHKQHNVEILSGPVMAIVQRVRVA